MNELLHYCRRFKRIFCYGAGYYGRILCSFLREHNVCFEGFLVSQKDERTNLHGFPIYEWRDLPSSKRDIGIVIGVGSKYSRSVLNTLEKYEYHDYFYMTDEELSEMESQTTYDGIELSTNICVLCYHRICNLMMDTWKLAVPPKIFEKHIAYLKQNFHILRFEEDWTKTNDPSVVITIDDGYADVLHFALPILEKYQVPATVFVTTGNIDKPQEFWWDKLEQIFFCNPNLPDKILLYDKEFPLITEEEKKTACYAMHSYLKSKTTVERENSIRRMANSFHMTIRSRELNQSLTIEELKKLAKSSLITIGGHTVTHPSLAMEPVQVQMDEIYTSKKVIESIIHQSVDVFSYPFGGKKDYTIQTRNLLSQAGYKKIASASGGLASAKTDSLDVPRNGIPGDCTVEQLQKKLKKIWCFCGG